MIRGANIHRLTCSLLACFSGAAGVAPRTHRGVPARHGPSHAPCLLRRELATLLTEAARGKHSTDTTAHAFCVLWGSRSSAASSLPSPCPSAARHLPTLPPTLTHLLCSGACRCIHIFSRLSKDFAFSSEALGRGNAGSANTCHAQDALAHPPLRPNPKEG